MIKAERLRWVAINKLPPYISDKDEKMTIHGARCTSSFPSQSLVPAIGIDP